jgi:hypothetical protein
MSIYSLVYSSNACQSSAGAIDIVMVEDILKAAREQNFADGITGALLFTEGRFVQALEGEREQVRATFERIRIDERHSDVDILSSQLSNRRRFKEWSMAFVGDSDELRNHFRDEPLAALGSRPAGDALLDFMLELVRNIDGPTVD